MSLEALDQLQEKVQKMLEANALLQIKIEEFKEKNIVLEEKINAILAQQKDLIAQNNEIKQEKAVWQNRLHSLLGKINDI
ncbi:cell division protein ZapB [Candidatus Williamhamiltonella defendens]|uniref:cell division protein ZapB n=1 Tax=Candidatus Williamhamiltonella defendens TaxID=138072 RepID=UPI00130EE527|nr:cell division protein ZapB [Candidatus Hamiltonella defensa]